jgi:Leucine-rich repeat (LRR) protein
MGLSLFGHSPVQAETAQFSCTQVTEIPQSECEALVALYDSTSGAGWFTHTDWKETSTPCSWHGIGCENGNVTSIILLDNNLIGELPRQLMNLSDLTRLHLFGNRLRGDFPLALCELKQLKVLFLGNGSDGQSYFTGVLPACLGSMSALTDLRIGSTHISGPIPPELGKLSKLEKLYLPSNRLTGGIPPTLTVNLTNLKVLDLLNNQLEGPIPSNLGSLSNLEILSLYSNRFSGQIPSELGNLTKIFFLQLQGNHLQGPIPASLGNLVNARIFRLENNALTGVIPESIASVGKSHLVTPGNTLEFNLDGNLLTINDPVLENFIRIHNSSFFTTQTLPPTDLQAVATTATSVTLTWNPVANTASPGFYEVEYTTSPSVPYTVTTQTANKQQSNTTVANLCPERDYQFSVRTNSLPQALQRNHLRSTPSSPVVTTTAPRTIDLLLLSILAIDSNLDKYYDEYIAGIAEATARDTRIMALVLADRSDPTDPNTRILKIQCGQVERLDGLPGLDLPADTLDPNRREYDMTNPRQVAAFIRWARTTLGGEAPAGDRNAIQTMVSYVAHGLPIAPATDISHYVTETHSVSETSGAALPATPHELLRGLPPAPTRIRVTPDQLTDETSLTLISPYSLTQALVLAQADFVKPITVLDIVHCFGGTIEELYELSNPGGQPLAEMVVTSPNYTYAGASILTEVLLSVRPEQSARAMAEALVQAHARALGKADGIDDNGTSIEHPRIIVGVDLSKVAAIKTQVDLLASAVMTSFAQSHEQTKALLLASHSATTTIKYDTVPTAYGSNDDPTDKCPHDYRLTAHDALSDLPSFARQLQGNATASPAIKAAATAIITAVEAAIITRTLSSGVPWFAHNPALEPWNFTGAGGIALYTDFHGITVGGNTYIGWQAHWYTNTNHFGDNPHPYQFVRSQVSWANVIQSYWADQLGTDGVKTLVCVTMLPQVRQRPLYLPVIRR